LTDFATQVLGKLADFTRHALGLALSILILAGQAFSTARLGGEVAGSAGGTRGAEARFLNAGILLDTARFAVFESGQVRIIAGLALGARARARHIVGSAGGAETARKTLVVSGKATQVARRALKRARNVGKVPRCTHSALGIARSVSIPPTRTRLTIGATRQKGI